MRNAITGFLAILGCLIFTPVYAQNWYTGGNDPSVKGAKTFGASIDFSVAATTIDTFHATLIGTISPFTASNVSGFRLRIGGLTGSYKYTSTIATVGSITARETAGYLLLGYEWAQRAMTFSIYGGFEAQNRTLSKPDPNNTTAGTSGGFKMAIDYYSNPTDYTMVSANMTYSTNNNAYYVRLKGGLAIFTRVFVGPEILFLGDNFYGQWRGGVHLTGMTVGQLQLGVSGGFVNDRRSGSGGYGILDMRLTF